MKIINMMFSFCIFKHNGILLYLLKLAIFLGVNECLLQKKSNTRLQNYKKKTHGKVSIQFFSNCLDQVVIFLILSFKSALCILGNSNLSNMFCKYFVPVCGWYSHSLIFNTFAGKEAELLMQSYQKLSSEVLSHEINDY